jgi:outer membrane protein assembly complex protein YaeT
MRGSARRRRALGVALVLWSGWLTAGCHEGDVRVTALDFHGNHAVTTKQLKAVLATKSSGWLPWAPKQYFNRQEFENDLSRIRRYYDDRGYPNAKLTEVGIALNDARDAVRLNIGLDEGQPIVVDRATYEGFDVLDAAVRKPLSAPPLEAGAPRDRDKVIAARQLGIDLLRDNGYAYAAVMVREDAGSAPQHVSITFTAVPGPPTVFGDVSIDSTGTLSDRVIRRELAFTPGEPYRYNRVIQSQRRVGALPIIRFANVDAKPPEDERATAVPVKVTFTENPPRRFSLGLGYGSEERFRGSIAWSHLNFLGNARQLTADARYSAIDRGVRLTLHQPYFYHSGLSLDVSTYLWRTREQSLYISRTYGGQVGVTYRIGGRGRGSARAPGLAVHAAYLHEFQRYEIDQGARDDLSDFETLIALGFNPIDGRGKGTKAGLAFDVDRNTADNLLNPRSGYGVSLHVETIRPGFGGTFRYDEIVGEARGYIPLAQRLVIAGRARFGTLAAASDADVAFSERYFLGGSSTLRGWGRYQVAPLVRGLPIGGRTVFDSSGELRLAITAPISAVAFVDAGNVWEGSWAARLGDLRADAGIGLRYVTPIGLIRGDLGVQLNPYPFLLINGKPETRHYRLHFSIGQAF